VRKPAADPHRSRRPDAVGVQKYHDLSDDFLLGQAAAMRFARTGPMPSTSRRRSGSVSMTSNTFSPKARSSFLAQTGPMPRDGCGGRGLEKPSLELLTVSAVIRPVAGSSDPLTGGNHRGMANDRDEIAVASRLHPDDAEAVFGVLVGDALNQSCQHLSVGWLWLRLHTPIVLNLVAETLPGGRRFGAALGLRPAIRSLRFNERAARPRLGQARRGAGPPKSGAGSLRWGFAVVG
jgi:hypothetical protein